MCALFVIYFVDICIRCFCQLIFLASQILLLDCWPFDFLRTQCRMHGSQRSNGQSPPSDCSLQITPPDLLQGVYIGFCLSLPLSLFFSTLFPLYMYMRCFFVLFCVSNMLCASSFKYYCDVLSSSFVKKKQVFIWMLYCFEVYVCGLSWFMLILIIFCCILYFVLFFSWYCVLYKFFLLFCVLWLPLCSSCDPLWISPSPVICLFWIGVTNKTANKTAERINRKVVQISLVKGILKSIFGQNVHYLLANPYYVQ